MLTKYVKLFLLKVFFSFEFMIKLIKKNICLVFLFIYYVFRILNIKVTKLVIFNLQI